ncbi:hypothetical protein VSP9026_03968 [Vibrio spartinae]|uniref:Uncharacterized protein n=2 Tax=Vibrio spartinae TaxID=1918945 RepID=A0A1N6M9Z6_9VIBR|nr:hypothetical protein VSP9026_03968 [Vibrio spartinae]
MKLPKTLLLGGLLLSSTAFAGAWTEPLTVKDVSVSASEGRFSGAAQLRVTFDKPPVTSVCAATEKLAVYDTGDINAWMQTWSSMLLTAQAQNKKVQIYTYLCRANNVPLLYGVRVINQ